jgi:hypothetical protein
MPSGEENTELKILQSMDFGRQRTSEGWNDFESEEEVGPASANKGPSILPMETKKKTKLSHP